MNKKLLLTAFVLFLLVFIVSAVDWYPAVFKKGWSQRSSDFCTVDSQCLVSPSGNRDFDGMPEKFFLGAKPYCIDDSQFILDFYCDNGKWSSRTKLLALELLNLANVRSPDDFSLFCAPKKLALNNLNYQADNLLVTEYFNDCHPYDSKDSYDCVNSICVLKYGNNVAFGTSLNIPVDDSKSFLRALDKSANICDSAKNFNNHFDLCSENIWYNHNTQSLIILPKGFSATSLPSSNINIESTFLKSSFDILAGLASNLSFFEDSSIFNNLYFARKGNKQVFGFLEKDKTEFGYDYIGLYMNNIGINNFCEDVIYNFDSTVVCDDSNDFLVIAKKTPEIENSLVNTWADLTAKLRLS
ncbi:hypothetical protein JW851_00420 [Candidatus Woesearchaeota archaeon]|nr:hypothetical protein [Candidatus Woesearchaeota archaeon]